MVLPVSKREFRKQVIITMGSTLKGFLLVLLGGVMLMGQAAYAQPQVDIPNQAAFDIVRSTTDTLLAQITENRDIYQQDTEVFFADVDGLLSTIIDYKRIARRVMAKYYKRAEPAQQDAFRVVFKRSLMKVYAKALLEYKNERIVILPPSKNKKASTKKQRVDIELYNAAGKKYPITYSMYLDKQQHWKMENVIVNGVNIGLTYRNQFARLMKVNQNDIDLVIANWTSDINADQ